MSLSRGTAPEFHSRAQCSEPEGLLQPKRPIRVLQVVPWLDPALGGPSQSALNMCVAMRRAGIENTLVFAQGKETMANSDIGDGRLEREGIPVRVFDVLHPERSRMRSWGASPALVGWLAKNIRDHDVVHVHGAWGAPQLASLLAARCHGRPCVLTPHETLTEFDVSKGSNPARVAIKRRLKTFYLKNLALVVFSSNLEAQDSVPSGMTLGSTVIPHPLRRALEAPQRAKTGGRRPFTVGFLGRFHPKKNLDLLLRAVSATSNDARLVIAGGGPHLYESELRTLAAQLEMNDRVTWMGFLEGDARWQMLDSVDVLAMPSQYECFGMVAAEAMARGTPAVVSRNTGAAELVQRHGAGIVVSPNVSSFTTTLQELSRDRSALARMAASGPRGAQQDLSLRAYGQAIHREYHRLSDNAR